MNPQNGATLEVQDGRIEFDEKASADASHKKFSDKKHPKSRSLEISVFE